MKTVPIQTVHEVWDRVSEAPEDEAQQMARRFQKTQPYVLVYLLAMDENIMDEEERGWLVELGVFILETMYAANPKLTQVTAKDLDAAEEANLKFLQDMEEGSEMDYLPGVQKLVQDYNQTPLLGTVLEALMEGFEEEPELAPENTGLALLYLKTVIDCLDQ